MLGGPSNATKASQHDFSSATNNPNKPDAQSVPLEPLLNTLRPDAWFALSRAVILADTVWFLWPTTKAQTLGLWSNDINLVNCLGIKALKHPSIALNAPLE
jgi:hypothetical protein